MSRGASWIAARKPLRAAFAGLLCVVVLRACKSREPAPAAAHPVPAPVASEKSTPPQLEPKKLHLQPEPTFDLPEDEVIDPAEEQRAMKQNCCDEMPAAEIEAAVKAGQTEAKTPTMQQRKAPAAREARPAVEHQ